MVNRTKSLSVCAILVSLCLLYLHPCPAQNFESALTSELKSKLDATPYDTVKIQLLLGEADQLLTTNPTQAITYALHALTMARSADSEDQIDRALLKAGKILQLNAGYNKAMDFYNEYYARALRSGNRKNLLKVRHNIAGLKMSVIEKFDEALFQEMNSIRKAYEQIWNEERDSVIFTEAIPRILINLSHLAQFRGSLLEAEEFLQKISPLAQHKIISDEVQLQYAMTTLTLYIKMERYQDALEIETQTRVYCRQTGNDLMAATLDYYKGNIYMGLNNRILARQSYENSFSKGEALGNLSLMSESAARLAHLYQQSGEASLALHYKNKSDEAKAAMEKLSAATKANQSAMLEQVANLEKEMETIHRSNNLRQAALAVLLLLFVLGGGYAIFSAKRKHRKVQSEKIELEKRFEHTNLELEAMGEGLKEKDKQLTNEMMYRLQQNEQFEAIRKRLLSLNRHSKKEVKDEIDNIIKGLELSAEDISWKDFEIRFLNVYPDFYNKLEAINPKLTRNERRLAALLKMGFSTKEISVMTGQTEQTVVKSRHRLRKKFCIDNQNVTFEAFFEKF